MTYEQASLKIDNAQTQAEQVVTTCLLQIFKWAVIILAMLFGVAIAIAVVIVRHAFAFLRVSAAFAFSAMSKKPAQEDDWQDEDEEENPCSVSFHAVGAGR
jgi:hypothetical protein